jgi:glycosyltransferase involved in cell wall biosynthesis
MEKPAPELEGFQVQRCWKFNSISNILGVVRAIRKARPDVVWFNIGLSTMANHPVAAFVNTAIPAVTNLLGYNTHVTLHAFLENVDLSHANLSFPALYRLGANLATRILLRANGVHVLLPSYGRMLVEKYKVSPERIYVHSHGVFATEIQPPTRNESARILAFGSWGTYKRLESLLGAFSIVQKQVPGAELVIAGGDHPKARGYVGSLSQQCSSNNSIRFLGYVPESQLAGMFRSSAVAVLPYDSGAGSSGVAHVAAENGIPIVASDLPDFVEMARWEGLAVEFYQRGDVEGLAQTLLRVLGSTELRAQMAAQNAAAASKITFDRIVGEYLESFQASARREDTIAGRLHQIREPGRTVKRGPGLTQNQIQEIQ